MIFTAWCACCAMSAAAQDCEISLTIAKAAQIRGEKRCVSKFGRSENI